MKRCRKNGSDRLLRIESYLGERNLYYLPKEETPYLVIVPNTDSPIELQQMGQALAQWQKGQGDVTNVLGLDKLLAGVKPQVGSHLFHLPIGDQPCAWTQPVALVMIRADSSTERDIFQSLCALAADHAIAWIGTWRSYNQEIGNRFSTF